ncbi:conserved hypothetical protein [Candidatus Desulfosporosinus infrequens]|uniref:Uncharacterized protein n=1 Tax=Candidatus Desulfosporosinus infrequens TaxID=2043169 RepID=A0A2U3KPW8_9FIRM|nr:conserved hypothetical protein [Candidatus Desulfosporosinus infrequens]
MENRNVFNKIEGIQILIFKALIFSVIVLTYFSLPIFLITKLAEFKSLGRVKKKIIIFLIVVVSYLVTTE